MLAVHPDLREAHHRCSNDLQLVVSMIQLAANRSADGPTRQALEEVANRVRVLANGRAALVRDERQDIATVLREVCDALQALAEPRTIAIALEIDGGTAQLSDKAATAAGLAVNELVTNALKHAFKDRESGLITVSLSRTGDGWVVIQVSDDGLPFGAPPDGANGERRGLGLDLARRMVAAQSGLLMFPRDNTKSFELRLPAETECRPDHPPTNPPSGCDPPAASPWG